MERKRKGLIFPTLAFRAKSTAPGKVMKRRHILMVGLTLCLALAMLTFAPEGGESDKGGYMSVCVTFGDAPGDLIRSDGRGSFCDSAGGVMAIVGVKRGGFRLDTNGRGRMVSLNFDGACVADCVPPFPTGLHDIDLRIGEEYDNGWLGTKLDIVDMDGGETRFGRLRIDFAPTGGQPSKDLYRIVFGRFAPGSPTCGDPVTVVRADDDENGPVNSWTLSATAGDEACLFEMLNNWKDINHLGRFHLPFSIDVVAIEGNQQPVVTIISPTNGSTFDTGQEIYFAGTASDTEDGDLTADDLVWNSSDGQSGVGASFSVFLSDGSHTITASATDSGGQTGSASITITVGTASQTIGVASIDYATRGGKSGDKNLQIICTLDKPVGGAVVSIELYWGTTLEKSFIGTTDGSGVVKFSHKNASSGIYSTDVTDVMAAGYTWDDVTPLNGFTKF